MRTRVFVPVVLLICGLAACDGLRESDYEGEVLATLEGTVTTSDARDVPEDISIPVIWDVMTQEPRLRFAEFPEVTGDFPARFRLDFHQPPEEGQLVEFPDGNAVVLGRLFITTYDPDEPLVLDEQGSAAFGSWGCNDDQIIAYIREDVLPGSAAASYFGCGLDTEGSRPCSDLTAGYHVMNIVYGESHNGRPDGESCGSLVSPDHPNYCEPDDMRLAADDLDTEIVFNVGGYSDCFSPWYRDPQTGW